VAKVCSEAKTQNLDFTWIHNIHDADIYEVKDSNVEAFKEIVKHKAKSPYSKMSVPLDIDIKVGKSWDEIA
jgi:DNA polymerase I-like protein with 3'-5' exonuclease and polymerase domains